MIKRIGAMLAACMLIVMMSSSVCFAGTLEIEKSSPKNGETGTAIENLGVKLYFTEPMYSEKYNKQNEKCFTITDEKGKEVPILVVFNSKKGSENQVLVLEDTTSEYKVKADSEYTLTISDKLVSASGNTLSDKALSDSVITFRTLNQKRSQAVNMAMMVVMMLVMVGATIRSTKKAEEEKHKNEAPAPVNPYKEAKKTGKSVEEIVAKAEKEKAKYEEKEAKRRAAYEAELAEEEERRAAEEAALAVASRKHVSRPRPISEAGSEYKSGRKALAEQKAREEAERRAKGTTNPKNGKKKKK